jgi:hypothetical protein
MNGDVRHADAGRAAEASPDNDRSVVLLVKNETLFGRISGLQRYWVLPGVRPSVPNQVVHESLYAFASVDPASGVLTCLVLPESTLAMMNHFLAQVVVDFANSFVVMQKEFPNVLHQTLNQVIEAVSTGLRRLAAASNHLLSMTFFLHLRAFWRQPVWSLACAA